LRMQYLIVASASSDSSPKVCCSVMQRVSVYCKCVSVCCKLHSSQFVRSGVAARYIHTHIHERYTRAYMHVCIRAYTHTYIHTYIHTCIHTCIHAACISACIYAYIRARHVQTYMHTYVHTFTYIHACIHTCIHQSYLFAQLMLSLLSLCQVHLQHETIIFALLCLHHL